MNRKQEKIHSEKKHILCDMKGRKKSKFSDEENKVQFRLRSNIS